MCQGLKRNICGLPNDATRRAEVDRQTINYCLSPELQYSCRYWAHHLVRSKGLDTMMCEAFCFLRKHFLHWLEAMGLLGLASEVVEIITLLQAGAAVSCLNSSIY